MPRLFRFRVCAAQARLLRGKYMRTCLLKRREMTTSLYKCTLQWRTNDQNTLAFCPHHTYFEQMFSTSVFAFSRKRESRNVIFLPPTFSFVRFIIGPRQSCTIKNNLYKICANADSRSFWSQKRIFKRGPITLYFLWTIFCFASRSVNDTTKDSHKLSGCWNHLLTLLFAEVVSPPRLKHEGM